VTLQQWRELQRAIPSTISLLAGGELDDDSANGPLHDALEEEGRPALAEHFSTGCVHDKCWALRTLAGEEPLAQLELSKKQAAKWLGISENQFERIVEDLSVETASDIPSLRGGYVCHKRTWAPAVIFELYDAPEVVAVRPT
jgi:hypothetical protein